MNVPTPPGTPPPPPPPSGPPPMGPPGGPPPGGYGAPPPGYGPPPQKKSRVGLVIGIVVGVVVLLAVLAGLAIWLFVGAVTGPADTTNAFLKATKEKNVSAMDAQACSAWVKGGRSQDILDQLDAVEPDRGTLQSYNINESSIVNSQATTHGTMTYSQGETFPIAAELTQENGDWKLCSITEDQSPPTDSSD